MTLIDELQKNMTYRISLKLRQNINIKNDTTKKIKKNTQTLT